MKKLIVLFSMASVFCFADTDFTDTDGDGLPDVWETHFGLSPTDATWINGADGDPDMDGLSNLAEYRAGRYVIGANTYGDYTFCTTLSPVDADSAQTGLLDKWYIPAGALVSLGWMFTDHDKIPDSWEAITSNNCSQFEFNGPEVLANGWPAFDNFQMSQLREEPKIAISLRYSGHQSDGAVTIYGYSSLTNAPDVIYTVPSMNGSYTLSTPVSGNLKRSTEHWVALKGDTWARNTPLGYAKGFPFYSGIGPTCNIVLTDNDVTGQDWGGRVGFSPEPNSKVTRVRIQRVSIDGIGNYSAVVFDDLISTTRNFLHEGDFMKYNPRDYFKPLWLDNGLPGVPESMMRTSIVYRVYIGSKDTVTDNQLVLTFTNRFVAAQAATLADPVGGAYVYGAHPTFRFSAPNGYYAYIIELRDLLAASTVYFRSYDTYLPQVDPDGLYTIKLNIYPGQQMLVGIFSDDAYLRNKTYNWRVALLNQKTTSDAGDYTWTAWSKYKLPLKEADGRGSISVNCIQRSYIQTDIDYLYYRVHISAYLNASMSGEPETTCILDDASCTTFAGGQAVALLSDLRPGQYYIVAQIQAAFIDGLHVRNTFGVYSALTGVVKPVTVTASANPVSITVDLEPVDSDRDYLPDSWEYEQNPTDPYLMLAVPSTGPVNPTLLIEE